MKMYSTLIRKQSLSKKHVISLFVIIFLISLNFYIGSYTRENLSSIMWNGDDVFYISMADSFRNNGEFLQSYMSSGNTPYSSEEIINNFSPFPDKPSRNKGPMHAILLGTIYKITETPHNNLYSVASFFNNVLTSIFIVLFFLFIQKKINFKIALLSSILVSTVPFFGFISGRVFLEPLLFIFSIAALFFLEQKKTHYILFGIFATLAHLTHPMGITLVFSYLFLLLLKKDFKGSLILFVTWTIILVPWFIRNFFIFGDIGPGLYLPFSDKISQFFQLFLPNQDFNFIPSGTKFIPTEGITSSFAQLTEKSFFNDAFSIDFLLFFILAFFTLAFLNLHTPKKNLFPKLIIITTIFGIYLFIFTYAFSQAYLQIFFLFILSPIVIYYLYKKKKNWFTKQTPTFFYFTIIYSFFHLIGIYSVVIAAEWEVLPTRFLIFAIILLIPLSLVGYEKIIRYLPLPAKKEKRSAIFFLILIITISPIIIQNAESSEAQKNHPYIRENSSITQLNSLIRDNTQSDKIIASNSATYAWFKTGIPSISLPNFITNQETFEKYIDYFGISYLVVYEKVDSRYQSENLPEKIMSFLPLNYVYVPQIIGNSFIFEIKDVLEIDISNPLGVY